MSDDDGARRPSDAIAGGPDHGNGSHLHNSRTMSRALGAAAVYVGGAAAYYAALQGLGVTFQATPLILGIVMLAASIFRARLLASAVLLLAWGAAAIALEYEWLPRERSSAVYMIAFGLAALALLLLRRRVAPRVALESAAIIMLVGGLSFFAAYEVDALGRPWLWSLALIVNAAGLVAVAWWRQRRSGRGATGEPTDAPAERRTLLS